MDLKVKILIVEEDRLEHIARHNVTLKEILEILSKDYTYIKGKLERWLVIGKTRQGRFLAIVLGTRSTKDTYGLVTARDSKKKEKNFYLEFVEGIGGNDDKS